VITRVVEPARTKHHALFKSVKPIVVRMLRDALVDGAKVDDLLFLIVDKRCSAAVDVVVSLVAVDPDSMNIQSVGHILIVAVVRNARLVLEDLLPPSGLSKVDAREHGTVLTIVTCDDGHAVLGGFRPKFSLVN